MQTEHLKYVERCVRRNPQLIKITPARKPVMLNGVLAWPSCLIFELNTWRRSWSCYPGSFPYKKSRLIPFLFYLSEKWVTSALEIIKDVAGSKGELILYFKSKFWAWVGKLRADSVHRIVIYSLRPLSKLRRARLKLFTLGGNLFKLSLATYSVRFLNESLEFVYDRTPRYKCKTPSSGTAFFLHFSSHHRTVCGRILGCNGLVVLVLCYGLHEFSGFVLVLRWYL